MKKIFTLMTVAFAAVMVIILLTGILMTLMQSKSKARQPVLLHYNSFLKKVAVK